MATYTAAQLRDFSSVPAVKQSTSWSDDKVLLFQSTAETILDSLDLDSTMSGYSTAYNNAVMMIFDWLAENPTHIKSEGKGKMSRSFWEMLPPPIALLLQKFRAGEKGTLFGVKIQRNDMALR